MFIRLLRQSNSFLCSTDREFFFVRGGQLIHLLFELLQGFIGLAEISRKSAENSSRSSVVFLNVHNYLIQPLVAVTTLTLFVLLVLNPRTEDKLFFSKQIREQRVYFTFTFTPSLFTFTFIILIIFFLFNRNEIFQMTIK